MFMHESGDQTAETNDRTYSWRSGAGAEVGQAQFVCEVSQKRGPLAFTTAAQLKCRNNTATFKSWMLNCQTLMSKPKI